MGILSRATDLVYTFRFLKLLTTKFENTPAYEMGLIDDKGNLLRKPRTSEEKSSYTKFHKLVFNIKKILEKIPGSRTLSSYASALYLIKEEYGIDIERVNIEMDIDSKEFVSEQSSWFILEDGQLAPGVYRHRFGNKVLNESGDEMVKKDDKIRVLENSDPVGNVFGLDVYEAVHMRTQQKIYVTVGEIIK